MGSLNKILIAVVKFESFTVAVHVIFGVITVSGAAAICTVSDACTEPAACKESTARTVSAFCAVSTAGTLTLPLPDLPHPAKITAITERARSVVAVGRWIFGVVAIIVIYIMSGEDGGFFEILSRFCG